MFPSRWFHNPFIYFIEAPKKVLSHKEKKELKKKQKLEAEIEKISKKGGEGHSALGDNFTVAQALKTGGALVQLETAVDIKIDKFSIAAKGKDLFRDAALTIAQGRRWVKMGIVADCVQGLKKIQGSVSTTIYILLILDI